MASSISCKCLSIKVTPVTPPIQHGECPLWDNNDQVLYYVNTFGPDILRWQPNDNTITTQHLDGHSVGIIVPIKNQPKTFVVYRDRRIDMLSWIFETNTSNRIHVNELTSVEKSKSNNQFNDGKVDANGHLWIGTLTRNADLSVSRFGGSLYKVHAENLNMNVKLMQDQVSISNGMAWSKDNTKFFYIDSETRKIMSYKLNLAAGTIASPNIIFDLTNHKNLTGIPDGMTIDTDDNLWVALYGGKSVIKINSSSGKLLQAITIPATYVTSATFGGTKFDTLYVTTSRLKLTPNEIKREPHAGSVFTVSNLGVQGLPANEFAL